MNSLASAVAREAKALWRVGDSYRFFPVGRLVCTLFASNLALIASGLLVKAMRWDETWPVTEQLLMTSEHTVATYLSALQFVLAGITGFVFLRPTTMADRLSAWLVSAGTIFLGIDDAFSIHEKLGSPLGKYLFELLGLRLNRPWIRPWMVIYLPLFGLGLVAVFRLWRWLRPMTARWAAVAGAMSWMVAISLEILERRIKNGKLHAIQVGIEESAELMGAWLFMLAFALAASHGRGAGSETKSPSRAPRLPSSQPGEGV